MEAKIIPPEPTEDRVQLTMTRAEAFQLQSFLCAAATWEETPGGDAAREGFQVLSKVLCG